MNVTSAVLEYVMRMVSGPLVVGMKVLLLDSETAGIVSLVCPQSAVLQKEVYLFERLESRTREAMLHLKAITFVRPTHENIALLKEEIRDPKYGEYHVFFSNIVTREHLEELAQCDSHEIVKQVQEYYGDYFAINQDLFSLYCGPAVSAEQQEWQRTQERAVQGLCSVLLSLRKRAVVRYARDSDLARRCATELARRTQQEAELFDVRRAEPPPLLLILDRRDDPVTPLLFQWTYQAMVHEMMGLVKNRVVSDSLPAVAGRQNQAVREAVLSQSQDDFFREAMFMDFGELGEAVRSLVDQYGEKSKGNEGMQSLEDIKKFLERYPEFRKMGASASKHVALMTEISKRVEQRRMMELGRLEQELACHSDHASAWRQLCEKLSTPGLDPKDQLRLALLYCLRYEEQGRLGEVVEMLNRTSVPSDDINAVTALIRYAGSRVRSGDLFGNRSIWAKAKSNVKRGLRDVQNVYTEHTPQLMEILDAAFKGKLKSSLFPSVEGAGASSPSEFSGAAEIIVFVVGGVTFEEALRVAELNKAPPVPNGRVILGGTDILNSSIFLDSLKVFANTVSGTSSSEGRRHK